MPRTIEKLKLPMNDMEDGIGTTCYVYDLMLYERRSEYLVWSKSLG